jgi:serine/threonine-protein kinase
LDPNQGEGPSDAHGVTHGDAYEPSGQGLREESSIHAHERAGDGVAFADASREGSGEIVGRYTLLSEIAQGELTTIYLARQHGSAGFQRLVALKRLRPTHADPVEAEQLMLDEGRLASSLHHANIVGVLDVGTETGPYVVMDYVEGDDLESILVRAGRERHPRFTVPLIVDILNGLHAVHTAVDDRGAALGMVHQAPRSRHVLVGIDGTGRLTDFTQARARIVAPSRLRSDRVKVAAMAPEQALAPDSVDHRTDLFIVGLMLWETLTGERLFFTEEGEAQTFQNLLHRRIPRPSEIGLRPPRCFDTICLRALERDPRNRYASALEMARDLRDTALNQALFANNGEIGQWVKALAGKQLIERRRSSGSDAPSYELPNARALSSSGYHSSVRSADPYGSGLIYGGSFTRVGSVRPPVQRSSSADLDQTPAVGLRAALAPTQLNMAKPPSPAEAVVAAAAHSEDEHTPRHVDDDEAREPRERRDTDPMWKAVPSSLPPPPDADTTHPAGFVPARPGDRRDTGLPSPGAYSEFGERKSSSHPPAHQPVAASPFGSDEGVPTMRRAVPHEDLMEVTTVAPMTASHAAAISRAMEDASPAVSGLPIEPLPLGRPKNKPLVLNKQLASTMMGMPTGEPASGAPRRPAIDGPSPLDSRVDSKPTRLSIPASPVGSPYRAATPSKMPGTFDLPKTPATLTDLTERTRLVDMTPSITQLKTPPSTLDDLASRIRRADSLYAGKHSLSPPDSGARTMPPVVREDEELPRGRSYKPLWVTAGVLVAIICVAIGVGARRWFDPSEPARRAATQPIVRSEPVATPAPPVQPTAPAAAQPSAEPARDVNVDSAALSPSSIENAATRPLARKPAAGKPGLKAAPIQNAAPAAAAPAAPSPAAPSRDAEPAARDSEGPLREVDPARVLSSEPKPADTATPRPKRRKASDVSRGTIPDNPY